METLEKRRVWAWSTRVFHWGLVVSVIGGLYLGEFRSFSNINLHFYFGYATLALVAFRLLLGVIGPPNMRLGALFPSIRALFSYSTHLFRRRPSGVAGHNPMGALSVLAMIVSLLVQCATGLIAEDDSLFAEGPLRDFVSSSTSLTANAVHYWNSRILMALIALHIAALLFYLFWKRENLVKPMISGWKWVKPGDSDQP